jgi:acyl-coenzyme A synthetase/AMP-(fatty) acid ligase
MTKRDYADVCRDFRWADRLAALGWTATGPVNVADTIVDRHVGAGRPALRWFGKDGAWFEGRADDVIKSAGYRIGPFEVESAILHHPDVAEAAAVGKPDALRGQIVKAYVVLRPGVTPRPDLVAEIVTLVKTRVGRHQYPREVEIVQELPKTETGKIQRFLLRRR